MAKKIYTGDYFKIMHANKKGVPQMYLYGVIGQKEDWWKNTPSEGDITDIAFVLKLRELEEKHDRIDIRLNGPGGSVHHGNAIITAIQNSEKEIHLFNDGNCASMIFDIWLAAKDANHRHMATNAMNMVHQGATVVYGNSTQLRQVAEVLDKYDGTVIGLAAKAFGLSKEEIIAKFYDGEDHFLNYEESLAAGLITDAEKYEAEVSEDNTNKKGFFDLVKSFADNGDDAAKSFLDYVGSLTKSLSTPFSKSYFQSNTSTKSPKSTPDMNKQELKEAIKNGDLNIEDLTAELAEQGYEVNKKEETPPTPPATDPAPETISKADLDKAIEDVNKTWEKRFEKFKEEPAAPPTHVPFDSDDPYYKESIAQDENSKELDKLNKQFAELGETGSVQFKTS